MWHSMKLQSVHLIRLGLRIGLTEGELIRDLIARVGVNPGSLEGNYSYDSDSDWISMFGLSGVSADLNGFSLGTKPGGDT